MNISQFRRDLGSPAPYVTAAGTHSYGRWQARLPAEGCLETKDSFEASRWTESDDLDFKMLGAKTHRSALALLQTGRCPGKVVVNDAGGPLEIQALRRNIRDEQVTR